MNNYLKEIKAISIFLAIGLILFGISYLINKFKLENYIYKGFLLYILTLTVLAILSNLIKSKILEKITSILLIPGGVLLVILTFLLPLGFILIHIIYYVVIVILIPELFFFIMKTSNLIPFENHSTIVYIKLTISVFIAVLFNFQIRKLIYLISPARLKNSEKIKPYELDKLTDYILSENNVRYIIYSLYVILLFIINILNFENKFATENLNNDKAILQSFVSFIAFERSLSILKQLEFKPSDFLIMVLKSIMNKFKSYK